MISVKVAKYGLQFYDSLAIQHNVHTENAVRRGMMRPHGNFEQIALRRSIFCCLRSNSIGGSSSVASSFADTINTANHRPVAPSVEGQWHFVLANTSS